MAFVAQEARDKTHCGTCKARYDVRLALSPSDDGELEGFVEYCTALFHHDTMIQFADHFKALLMAVGAGTADSIDDLDMMSAQEGSESPARIPRGAIPRLAFHESVMS